MLGQMLWATAGALVVTNLELAFRSGRHPFGDSKQKALGWWLAVAFIDSCVAALLAAGITALPASVEIPQAGGGNATLPALMGVLGPLALRSPIRRAAIDDRESPIGITYLYDVVRVKALYALDDRMTWLVRSDVRRTCAQLVEAGHSPSALAKVIREHAADHRGLDGTQRDAVEASVSEVLALPPRLQMSALIKVARKYRFKAVLDNLVKKD
jgi:hypothetical protein